ncbi:MAG TPA: glycosyltransferase [Arachnia sp.]|nr:glycosyltransferase [Arachnia sp.]
MRTVTDSPTRPDAVTTVVLSQADPRHGPYGIDILPRFGYDVVGVSPRRNRVLRKLRDVMEHRSGVLMDVPIRSAPSVLSADLVLGLLEPITELAAVLKGRGIPPYARPPLVMIECWLAEWLRNADALTRRRLVDRFKGADLLLALSRNQIDILVDSGFREDQVDAIVFGCAPGLFEGPAVERDLDIVAAGFDRGRDYATFLEGVRDLDARVHLLCQPANLAGLSIPGNVTVDGVVPYDQYRSMLRRARVVAVPTRELAYPTGQSVALDAGAAGAAIAMTGTVPLCEYFDDSSAVTVPPRDAAAWATSLRDLLRDEPRRLQLADAAHRRVLDNYTYEHMWGAFRQSLHDHCLPAYLPNVGGRNAAQSP